MSKKIVITISREYGSGGREIGAQVAKELGIPCYDKQLIELASQESGLSSEYIEKSEQRTQSSLLYSIAMSGGYATQVMPIQQSNPDKLFIAQSKIIRDLAEKSSCVIIGRCADYILRDNPHCMNLFVHADLDFRIKHASEKYGIAHENAASEISKMDKQRKNHYQRYTDRRWGDAKNFHASVNSGVFGIDATVKCVVDLAKGFLSLEPEE